MFKRLLGRNPPKFVIDKDLLEKINSILRHSTIVILVQVDIKVLSVRVLDHFIHPFGQCKLVDPHVIVKRSGTKRLYNPDYLPMFFIPAPHEFIQFK